MGVLRETSLLSMEKILAIKISTEESCWIDYWMRTKASKTEKENKIIIGTWKRILIQPGKMQELVEQISETQLEILGYKK